MENIVCQFCHQLCDKLVFLQCKHPICSKCAQMQFSSGLLRKPCDLFHSKTKRRKRGGKKKIDDEKKIIDIYCPKCNEKTILFSSQGDIKLSNDQQLSVVSDGLGENQQQRQYIPDEILQRVFQFLDAKELFTTIRFTCKKMDKIVCISLLSLHCQGLRINGLTFALAVLPKETQLQELNLMENNIGDNEATAIAKVFPLIQQLQILNLSWNRIGNLGANAIAKSIKNLKQLQVLDISWNPLGKSGITVITNATNELTKLKQLDIYEKCSKSIYERVQQVFNEKGTELNLTNCNIDANVITLTKVLPHLTHLERLYLGNNQIGDTGATAIANTISDLIQLQELDLGCNQIGDVGATAIANSFTNLTQLQVLNLGSNRIGYTGATAIANSINKLTQLQKLYLYDNQIEDIGAIALANSITNWTRLHYLYIFNNNTSEPVKQQLQQHFGYKLWIYNNDN